MTIYARARSARAGCRRRSERCCREAPVTAVQAGVQRRRWRLRRRSGCCWHSSPPGHRGDRAGRCALCAPSAAGRTPYYADIVEHFKYGSIGSSRRAALPYCDLDGAAAPVPRGVRGPRSTTAPSASSTRQDGDGQAARPADRHLAARGRRRRHRLVQLRGLPYRHWRERRTRPGTSSPGMPSNNLDLYRFIRFLLEAGADERLSPDTLIPAMRGGRG